MDRSASSDMKPNLNNNTIVGKQSYDGANARLARTQSAGAGPMIPPTAPSSSFNGHCDRTANPMSKEDQDLVISSSEMAKMFPKPKAPCM